MDRIQKYIVLTCGQDANTQVVFPHGQDLNSQAVFLSNNISP